MYMLGYGGAFLRAGREETNVGMRELCEHEFHAINTVL